ncbi:MAG: hypothetical protein HQL71_13500 [Magnetococcales bacterium]|nr:hypothetical protein [Magnetococcales bacterium]
MATDVHTSDISSTGTVTSSSAIAAFYGWKAFDGVKDDLSKSALNGITGAWWQYAFTTAQVIHNYSLMAHSSAMETPIDWTLRGSYDDFASEDVVLHQVVGES